MASAVVAESTPSTPTADYTSAVVKTNNPLHTLARKWFAIRWQLARTVFARPLPFLTAQFKLKLGDLLITLPIAGGVILWSALLCKDKQVEDSGAPAAVVMLVVFALAVRNNSIVLVATGIPFERMLTYHKFFGGVAWIVSALHGLAYLLGDEGDDRRRRTRRRLSRSGGGFEMSKSLSGALTFYSLSALVFFSLEPIRRRFFDLFLRSHWVFFILIVVFGVIHGAGAMLFGFIPWVVDMLVRFGVRVPMLSGAKGVAHSGQVRVSLVAKDLVKVEFPRTRSDTHAAFHYHAGQYVFLCFPSIAKLEWHPFTIASAPHESMVTIYIKVLGDWTRLLAKTIGDKPHTATPMTMTMLMEGPYGAESIEMDHYSHLVFVSGGVGVTPMLSMANALYYESVVSKARVRAVQKARFVWSVRDREMIEAMLLKPADAERAVQSWVPQSLLSPGCTNSETRDPFHAEIFLTKGSQDLSHPVDQKLALCLKYGQRPDINKILQEVGEQAQRDKKQRVGVLVCGPQVMISEVVRASLRLTGEMQGVVFDVHQETFDF